MVGLGSQWEARIGAKDAQKGRGDGWSDVPATGISDCGSETLKGALRNLVDPTATVMTDEWAAYRGLGDEFNGHCTVNHSQREYVRYENSGPVFVATTNTAESWFALLKRAQYGIHHQMSKKHLERYCTERRFMWDHRRVSDGERMTAAIRGSEGKRLYYKQPNG